MTSRKLVPTKVHLVSHRLYPGVDLGFVARGGA